MWYFIISILIIIVLVSLLRIRLKFEFGSENNLLFVGVGRSGPEIDFQNKTGVIKFAGLKIKSFSLEKSERKVKKIKPAKTKRTRPVKQIAKVVPDILYSLWNFFIGTLKSVIIEEFHGHIKAGFENVDTTGIVFGYYQAVSGAVPMVLGRLHYTPVWEEASFSGSVKGSFALPLYRLFYQTAKLVFSLPLRDLIKLAIGTKEGDQDGK